MPAKQKKPAKRAPEAAPGAPGAPAALSPTPISKSVWLVLAYVVIVLTLDTLAARAYDWPIRWAWFRWNCGTLADLCVWIGLPKAAVSWMDAGVLAQFELFKFTFWFLIPFLFSLWHMDWSWFGVKRLKRWDFVFLGVFLLVCAAAVFLVPYLPGVREYYGAMARHGGRNPLGDCLWVVSWLLGWEFLHRYVLLRAANARWARWGWLLVPLSETVYHMQKPLLEAAGMGAFSLIATAWTRARSNMLPAFAVHLGIELTLVLYLLLA